MEPGHTQTRKASDEMVVSAAVVDFLHFMSFRRGASSTTIDTYRSILASFIIFVDDKSIPCLLLSDIDSWADSLTLRGLKPKTYRNKLCAVKSFVKYLYIKDLTTIKPEQIIIPKQTSSEATFLDEEESQRLVKACTDTRDKALVLCLLSSGLRISELANLRMQDVYKRSVIVRHGKGDKNRVTFITPETQKAIAKYVTTVRGRHPGYLFPNPVGEPLSRVMIAKLIRRYAVKADLETHVTAHTLRHTFATQMLTKGARVEDVQQLLGHSNIQTTLIYLHFTNDYLAKRYNKFMPKALA